MWTHDRLKAKLWRGEPVRWRQVKLNGHRFTLFMQHDKRLVGFERETFSDLEMTRRHPFFIEYPWWRKLQRTMPPISSVDGELYVPGGNAADAAHAIAECSEDLHFTPFAVPVWDSKNLAHAALSDAARLVTRGIGLGFADYQRFDATRDTEASLIEEARAGMIEGWVLKRYNYDGWWKVKPAKTVDCIASGFKDGKGKFKGMVGSIVAQAEIDGEERELACVSGMIDAVRAAISPTHDLGRVFEVEYQELGNGGRLIHPRFSRWRDDKPAHECRYVSSEL